MPGAIFKNRKPVPDKLLPFGFHAADGGYVYVTDIVDGQFRMTVTLSADGAVKTKVVDSASGEEYVLHRASGAAGAFVGAVRNDYERILHAVSEQCFEPNVFKSDDAQKIVRYLRDTYHDELEFLWQRAPENAVFRKKENGKWYGALLTVSRRKLGFDSDEMIEILDLRIEPDKLEATLDGKRYFPGYHMNKKHWYTICLDGSVPVEEICRRIDVSYRLA